LCGWSAGVSAAGGSDPSACLALGPAWLLAGTAAECPCVVSIDGVFLGFLGVAFWGGGVGLFGSVGGGVAWVAECGDGEWEVVGEFGGEEAGLSGWRGGVGPECGGGGVDAGGEGGGVEEREAAEVL